MSHGDVYDPDSGSPRMKAGAPAIVVVDSTPPAPPATDDALRAAFMEAQSVVAQLIAKNASLRADLSDARNERAQARSAAGAANRVRVEAERRARASGDALIAADSAYLTRVTALESELTETKASKTEVDAANVELTKQNLWMQERLERKQK